MKFPSERGGIMYWADSIGAEYIYKRLKSWSEAYGNFFKPSLFLEERATIGSSPIGIERERDLESSSIGVSLLYFL
nr:glyoxysomal fatty acid beta-oxidation multifunctional protein MFP-a-like [Nicotiana tomentosiformis]